MKAIAFFAVLFASIVTNANAQFLQQFPQQQSQVQPFVIYPQQQPVIQQPYQHGGGNGGDHTLLQLLAVQNMFQQQTTVQQGWATRTDMQLQQLLANQEAYKAQAAERDRFEQVYRGQGRAAEVEMQQRFMQQLEAIRMQQVLPQPPPKRGLFGRR